MLNGLQNYREAPTITTIESNFHPINDIPFPAITVCNTNLILKSSAYKLANKISKEKGINSERVLSFLKILPDVYLNKMNFTNYMDIVIASEEIGYNLQSLLFDLSQPCSRLLHTCWWRGNKHNCSSMFVDLVTPKGFCCTFNYQGETFAGYTDLHVRKNYRERRWKRDRPFARKLYVDEASVSSSGLQVLLNAEDDDYFASFNFFGTMVMVHDPDRYPDISTGRTYVQSRFDVKIQITASIVESSQDLRHLSPSRRNCYFEDEKPLQGNISYNYDTCTMTCKLAIFQKVCNCTPLYYTQGKRTKICTALDTKCVNRHSGIFNNFKYRAMYTKLDIDCNCLSSCNDITYDFISDGNKVYHESRAPRIFENNFGNKSAISVFFKDNVCIKYRRVSQATWESLLATFGGILGLYLGGSMVSVIEIAYHMTIQLWRDFHQEKMTRKKDEKNVIVKTIYNEWPSVMIPIDI